MAWDDTASKVWMDGELVDWKDATIHSLSHVVHYGTSVFEGIRAYENENGVAVFRLKEHVQRLFDSAKISTCFYLNTDDYSNNSQEH